jgi:hypothetical protein
LSSEHGVKPGDRLLAPRFFVRLGSAGPTDFHLRTSDLNKIRFMASPFRVFRKNVKPLLVVFGCLLILAWVGGSSLTTIMGPRGGGGDADPDLQATAVAASWDGGSVTNQDLYNLVIRRMVLRGFLDHVEGLGAQPSVMAGMDPPPLRVVPLRLAETPQQGIEQSVVQTKLFADAAREAGMYVDDNTIVQYLHELGRGRVLKNDMRRIIEGLRANNPRVSIEYVFDALRDELLARNFLMSNMYAAQTVTPQQRWQDWLRVNDRIVVEAAAIPVETYLVEVNEPTDAELTAFYDEYKQNEAGPDMVGDMELPSARPGFRVPRKIGVQFVQANFNDLVTKTEGEITEEEIAKYYEENKDLFIKADTKILEDVPALPEASPTNGAATETPPGDATKAGESDEAAAPPQAEGEARAATETETPTEPEGSPASETEPQPPPEPAETATPTESPAPANEESEAQPPSDGEQPSDADQSSGNGVSKQSVFRQVAFLQDQAAEGGEAESTAPADESTPPGAEASPATETGPADSASAESATPAAETAPAAEPAPTNEPATSPTTPPSAAPATSPEATASTDAPPAAGSTPPATEKPPAAEKPPEYQPLEEVRDLIRRNLATQRANDKIGTLMDEVLGELTKEFNAYFDRLLSSQADKEERPAPQAALADLAQLAEKHGLKVGKTEPEAWLEFRETPVGQSIDPDTRMPLSSVLYGRNDRELYQPILTVNAADGDRYIAMKSSDTPSRVPKLADVRDQVVRAWKLRKAAEIALKAAEKEAADAQKAGSSLVDFYASKPAVQVERIDPFSFLTRGDVPDQFGQPRFRFSQPDGIVAAGPALLQRVFELKDGEVGAVLNHDHSIAYVIRVVEHQDPPDTLRTAYLAEANSWDGLNAMIESHVNRARGAIVADITGGKGVDWKRDHDRVRDDSAEDASE